jgi:regulator of protease activity HflC (stomatin/prohibitin superfamily)
MVQEREYRAPSGYVMLIVLLSVLVLSFIALIWGISLRRDPAQPWVILGSVVTGLASFIGLFGFFIVNPNEGKVLQLFGSYVGTAKEPGLRWANPFFSKKGISLRVHNFESEKLKVNDHAGNPIEIASVVVWRVVNTAEAMFHVEDYGNFVHVQSEAALRNLASRYPYEAYSAGDVSLRSHTDEIAEKLQKEIQDRVGKAGVTVDEARISHLAYAPEIAGAMLRRQQAAAIVAARQKIVEGAVGMVEMALEMLSKHNVVELDNERRATMVGNLLVVLCADREGQPVVNVGTLYH